MLVKVADSGVLGARKVIVRHVAKRHKTVKRHKTIKKVQHVEAVTKVVKVAKPAKAVIKSAAFTG